MPRRRYLDDVQALRRRNRFPSFDNTAKSDNTRVVPVEKRTQYIRQKEKERVVKKQARKQRAKQVATKIVAANNPNGVSPWDTKSVMFIANAEAHPEQFEKEYANWYSKVPSPNTGAQLYDKNKVNLAKAQQAFYRDAGANIGVDWGNKLDPYTQRDLITNAAKSFGITNATPYTLPLFASFTPGMTARTFMGSAIGGEVGGLVGSQVGFTVSNKPLAPLVGGLAGGFIGGGIGSYVSNRNYIRLANALNNNIQNAKVNLSYIRPDFNRFKLGDVEINNPSLYYRQGSASMGEDFLNTGVVREGGGYANPMFAKGKLWYGIPTKEMLTQGRQVKVGKFNLTKANEASPKTDLLVSTGEMVPSNAKAMPKTPIQTKKRLHPYSEADIKNAKTNSMREFMLDFNDKYYNGELDDLANVTYVDTEMVRRIPANGNSANAKNTTLYRYEPGYGYRKVRTKDNIANYNVFMTDAADKYPYIIPNYTDNIEGLGSIANYKGDHLALTKQRLIRNNNEGYAHLENLRNAVEESHKYDPEWQASGEDYRIFPYDDYNIYRLNNMRASIIDDSTKPDAFYDHNTRRFYRQLNPKNKGDFDTPQKINIIDSHEFAHAVNPIPAYPVDRSAFRTAPYAYLGHDNNMELAARGTQLKNYFGLGLRNDPYERFTTDMLKYAAKHYVKDTGIDNNMSKMFFSINDWDKVANWINNNAPAMLPISLGLGYSKMNKSNKTKTKRINYGTK